MLDYCLIKEIFRNRKIKIGICGDIKHSRVAHSNIKLLSKTGHEVHVIAPSYFLDKNESLVNVCSAVENYFGRGCANVYCSPQPNSRSFPPHADSTENFLIGALYFYSRPNYDSIFPAVKYIERDLYRLIESFEWQE